MTHKCMYCLYMGIFVLRLKILVKEQLKFILETHTIHGNEGPNDITEKVTRHYKIYICTRHLNTDTLFRKMKLNFEKCLKCPENEI